MGMRLTQQETDQSMMKIHLVHDPRSLSPVWEQENNNGVAAALQPRVRIESF